MDADLRARENSGEPHKLPTVLREVSGEDSGFLLLVPFCYETHSPRYELRQNNLTALDDGIERRSFEGACRDEVQSTYRSLRSSF